MTVQSTNNRINHTALEDQTEFVYDFIVFEEEHMFVAVNFVAYNLPYEVTGVNDPNGGTVILSTEMNAGDNVALYRNVPATQEIDYKRYDAFPAETHERGLDKLTLLVQQVGDFSVGAIRFPLAEAFGPNSILPPITERSLKFLFFDVDGGVSVSEGTAIGGEGVKSVAMQQDGVSEVLLNFDNADSENPKLVVLSPNTPNKLVTLDGSGKLPTGTAPFTEYLSLGVDPYAANMLAANNDIPEVPAMNVRTVNQPLSLIQLDPQGQVPPGLINYIGLTPLGFIRGDDLCPKGGDTGGECIPPDARNPSERYPELVDFYDSGMYFLLLFQDPEVDGTMNLFAEIGDPTPSVVAVDSGDGIIYLNELLDPNPPNDVLVQEGWYLVPDMVTTTSAPFVSYDPTGNIIINDPASINVDLALTDLDTKVLDRTTGGTVTGQIKQAILPVAPEDLANKGYVDGVVLDLQNQIDVHEGRIVAIETELPNKVAFTDFALPSTSGVIKLRLDGNDCFISTTALDP